MVEASEIVFVFDTDALAQILIAGQQNILEILRRLFNVRSFVMSEVEVELLSNRKISGLIRPRLEKLLKSGLLKILSSSDLEKIAAADQSRAEVTLQEIRKLGADLSLHVQTGEAHTFAAAILLDSPAVSNDMSAIKVLEANGKPLPPTILRSFDIFGFSLEEGFIEPQIAEGIRNTLRAHAEWLPPSMRNASFIEGFASYRCRLKTSLATSSSSAGWSETFYLKRVS